MTVHKQQGIIRVMRETTYQHPNPARQRLTHFAAGALLIVMLLSVIGQIVLTVGGVFGGLMLITALLTALLILPVIMLTTAAPPVTISAEGITLHPHLWRRRFVPWGDVQAVKDYPLLPPRDAEAVRRVAVGRKRYRAAEGIMLIIPSLPPQYRIHGFFAGEGFAPIIALTNRTHQDYDQLAREVRQYTATH